MTRRALVAGAAAALLLSACSDDIAGEKDQGLKYGDSPLSQYMSSVWDGDPEAESAARIAFEEQVAQCMAGEGFEYTVPAVGSAAAASLEFDPDEMNTESWIATNGFGASSAYAEPAESPTDLNADYVASLSEASRAEYYEALYGQYGEGMTEEELESYVPAPEEQGCYGTGVQAAPTPDIYSDPGYQKLSEKMSTLVTTAREDPAVVTVTQEWSDCLADEGLSGYASQDELLDAVYAKYDELYGWTEGGPPDTAVTPAPQALADLRQWEIETALTDLACREEVGLDDAFLTVYHAAEEQFIVDHKSELDAIVAEYGS